MSAVQIRLLGTFVAEVDGASVPLSAQQRAILAMLALHRGRPVNMDRLIDGLWGEEPPATAKATVQVQVSNMRKALGPASDVVETQPAGYRLNASAVAVDIERLSQLIDATKALPWSSEQPQWQELGELCERPPLDDLRSFPFVEGIVTALEEQQLVGIERRIEAQVDSGDATVVAELEQLVVAHPYRERFTALLMLSLYRAARQADALAAFAKCRRVLLDELGLDPGPALQALEQAMLRSDPALDPKPARQPAVVRSLPPSPTPLLGRAHDLERIERGLAASPLVTITGPGGMGKTRAAVATARRQLSSFDDVVFVDLTDLTDADSAGVAVAAAVGGADHNDAWGAVAGWLDARPRLLVLDNLEQISDCGRAIAKVLPSATSRVLATSRTPLRIRAEQVVPLGALPDDAAYELFVRRLEAVAPTASADAYAVRELCRRLERHPLALELAAARCRWMPLEEVLANLAVLDAPDDAPGDLPERHRSLRANLLWSIDLLTPAARHLLPILGVFAAPFSVAAVERVRGKEVPGAAVAELVDAGLLTPVDSRYRIPQPLRDLAREELELGGDARSVHCRHAAWVAHEANGIDADRLRVLLPELTAAVSFLVDDGEPDAAAELLLAVEAAWVALEEDLSFGELARWLTVVIAAGPKSPYLLIRLLLLRQDRYFSLARDDDSVRDTLAAYELAREHQDSWGLARACHALGYRAVLDGRLAEAAAYCDEGEPAASESGDAALLRWFSTVRGAIAQAAGDSATAIARFRETLASSESSVYAKCTALINIVDAAVEDDTATATKALDEFWGLMPPAVRDDLTVMGLVASALVETYGGEPAAAFADLAEAASVRSAIGMRSHLEADLVIGAAAAQRVGDEKVAATLLALSEQLVRADAATRTDLHAKDALRDHVRSAMPARRRRELADSAALLQVHDWRGAVAYLAALARGLVGAV